MKKKSAKKAPRNSSALAAHSRKGGPMKHRLEPRGGAKNDQPELLDQAEKPEICDNCKGQGYTFDKYQGYKLDCNCPAGIEYRHRGDKRLDGLEEELADAYADPYEDNYIGVDIDEDE